MDLRRLRLFLAVVDAGGFTAAARREHVAQPAVSLAVRQLETELGAELVVRARDGARPTAAGRALLGPARRAMRDLDDAAAAVAAVTGVVGGTVELATLASVAADPVAQLVGRLLRAHPRVKVRMRSPANPVELAESVRTGEADLGVTESSPANHGLVEEPLAGGKQALVALGVPGARRGSPLALSTLAGVPLVLTPPGTSLRAVVDRAFEQAGVVPHVAVETAQRDALVPLALGGAGVTFVPAALGGASLALATRGAATTLATDPPMTRSLTLVRRPGEIGPAVGRLLELAALPTAPVSI